MIPFPADRPDAPESGAVVWAIQNILLAHAEHLLGPRDPAKLIYQPVFRSNGPILINTPSFDGAFAALSPNAAGYWPALVYELAHETVHLLDPIPGYTTWIEEGAAVMFSVEMSARLTSHPMTPTATSVYAEAVSLISELPAPTFGSLRLVRTAAKRLSAVTSAQLITLFPDLPAATARRLAEICVAR